MGVLRVPDGQDRHVQNMIPALENVAARQLLFAYTAQCTSFDFEPSFLGTARYVHEGSMAEMAVSLQQLHK